MALELITGHTGAAHVSAADDGEITASILGPSRPIMSTDGGKLVIGQAYVDNQQEDHTPGDMRFSATLHVNPFYQYICDGEHDCIVKSDESEPFDILLTYDGDVDPVWPTDVFFADVYIQSASSGELSLVAVHGTPLGDVEPEPPTPPSGGWQAFLRRFHLNKTSEGVPGRVKIVEADDFDMTPCLPTADAVIDWLTIDKSDPSDQPYQGGVNLVTIYDQDRIDASQGGGIAVASAWKAYTPSTGTIAARPSSIDLGNVEAHVWCRGYYGDDTTQIDADEGGIFTLTGYAEFDAGSGASGITLSPTGSDDVSWAFVVSDPFHFASRRGMSMQILNGASYAIVGGTSMKSNLADYFGPTSLLQVDLHLVKTTGGWQLVAYIPLTPGAGDMSIFQIKLFLMADALIHPCSAGDLPSYASELTIDDGTA